MGLNRIQLAKRALKEFDGQDIALPGIKVILANGGLTTDPKNLAMLLNKLDDLGIIKQAEDGLFAISV